MLTTSPAQRIRAELFSAFIDQMNSAALPYCLLSGYENRAEPDGSDVDFMVHPRDMHHVASLLDRAATNAGAMLVQAIPHETSACYFVLAKQIGSNIGYLNPDCSSDYRKRGRLWLFAEELLSNRRPRKNFYVASVSDEFTYYLIKKTLKQRITECQLRGLLHLYQRDPSGCIARAQQFWPAATVHALEKVLIQQDCNWFRSHLATLLTELCASAPVETVSGRLAAGSRDALRWLKRVVQPTGVSVLVCGGEKKERQAIAAGLSQALAPVFRWTRNVQLDSGKGGTPADNLSLAIRARLHRLQSTLVVGSSEREEIVRCGVFPSCSLAARLLLRPDIIFALTAEEAVLPNAPLLLAGQRRRVVHLNSSMPTEHNLEKANRAILGWLSARLARRMNWEDERWHGRQPFDGRPDTAALRSPGYD